MPAGVGSKSSLKSGQEGQRRSLERVEACAPGRRTTTTPLVCARQRPLQFPLRPYTGPKIIEDLASLSQNGDYSLQPKSISGGDVPHFPAVSSTTIPPEFKTK
jgi:hypothetical protein